MSTGLIALVIGMLAMLILAYLIRLVVKKKAGAGRSFNLLINIIVLVILSGAFLFLSLFVQTLNRYLHDQKIGTVLARREGSNINIQFADLKNKRDYKFDIGGDQWMVEGYIVRWNPLLRWLGAGSYYKIDRFSGRYESDSAGLCLTKYSIDRSHRGLWKYTLKYGNKLKIIDAAYGTAAFQYPDESEFGLYINDSGLIIKKN